ncbi:MAG TPA: WG repeat-containing protein [Haloplasmataceae bacterium]
MKNKYLFITLIAFIVFLGITINYYLTNGYEITYIAKNNITASSPMLNDDNEVLLPVAYLEYDMNKVYWGFINLDGEVAISLKYDDVSPFDENYLAIVMRNNKYGLINTKDVKVIDIDYDTIQYMGEGIYYLAKNNQGSLRKYNINTKSFQTLKEATYDFVSSFRESLAYVVKNNKLGYINTLGDIVIPLDYEYQEGFNFHFYNGYAFIKKNGKFGIIDKSNSIILNPQLDEVMNDYILKLDYKKIYLEGYDYVPYRIDNKWGYITRSGQVLINPTYLEAYPYVHNNLARVKLFANNYYNFIDKNGQLLNNQKYKEANDFYQGFAMVSFGEGKEGLINSNGIMVIDANKDYIGYVNQSHILVIDNSISKYYHINDVNNESKVIKISYYLGDDMTDCNVMLATDDKINYAILNLSGQRILPEITVKSYEQIRVYGKNYIALVAYEKKANLEYYTYLDSLGNLLWKVYKENDT